ncbi:MAG: hypothetical protein AVDCRST_MAG22-2102 [uncultured Rubrobacteraceae bacterium]|uniref:Uncharacterized protein n=1 Tax=uncultured Rubrobacteraceae bacterium TaxID=349277 RepID=A0A6J4PGR0_9ACTN|nr:MAG: hypothetical protein AVDCRST_MAG22-2102 [uncultured Rubrobacteraceae bacterium]
MAGPGFEPGTPRFSDRGGTFTVDHRCTKTVIGMRICVTIAHHRSPLSRSGCRQTVVKDAY